MLPCGILGKDWDLIDWVVNIGAAKGTDDYLDSKQIGEDKIGVITRVSVENKTANYDSLRIGPYDGATHKVLEDDVSPTNNQLSFSEDPIFLRERELLRAHLHGTHANDVLVMFAQGFWIRKGCLD